MCEKLPNSSLSSRLMANARSLQPKVDELDAIAQLNSAQVTSITEMPFLVSKISS